MTAVKDHYAAALSPVYTWMCGGFEAAAARNAEFFSGHGIAPAGSARALDLGAGSGFQTIPLIQAGFSVTAVDFDRALLDELQHYAGELPVTIVCDDITRIADLVEPGFELAVCMTDTVLHLESAEALGKLFRDVAALLEPAGKFVVTFRDLSRELHGVDRFIPVRSDAERIMTCFLEYEPQYVRVHDLIYENDNGTWALTKSWYRKLRLSPQAMVDALKAAGFASVGLSESRGLYTAIATRAAD